MMRVQVQITIPSQLNGKIIALLSYLPLLAAAMD